MATDYVTLLYIDRSASSITTGPDNTMTDYVMLLFITIDQSAVPNLSQLLTIALLPQVHWWSVNCRKTIL